jgi:hypothetical protein
LTTSKSPLSQLTAQAAKVAQTLKESKILKPEIQVAIVMDDKTLIMHIQKTTIDKATETSLKEMILKYMRNQREH